MSLQAHCRINNTATSEVSQRAHGTYQRILHAGSHRRSSALPLYGDVPDGRLHCWQAGVNGTFFVDASAFAYRCSDGGGWHDFFDVQPEVLVPWSAAREAAEGEPCVRHTFDSVDALLDSRFHIGWDSWDQAGAMRVCALYEPA